MPIYINGAYECVFIGKHSTEGGIPAAIKIVKHLYEIQM